MADSSAPESHADVIALIGNSRLAAAAGVDVRTVTAWKARNSIPGPRFVAVAECAAAMGHVVVTTDLLARLAAASLTAQAGRQSVTEAAE